MPTCTCLRKNYVATKNSETLPIAEQYISNGLVIQQYENGQEVFALNTLPFYLEEWPLSPLALSDREGLGVREGEGRLWLCD